MNILSLSDVSDYLGFIWEVIKDLVSKIVEVIEFVKSLILFIPKIFSIFPDEILMFLIPTITIIIFIFIFKFIK